MDAAPFFTIWSCNQRDWLCSGGAALVTGSPGCPRLERCPPERNLSVDLMRIGVILTGNKKCSARKGRG